MMYEAFSQKSGMDTSRLMPIWIAKCLACLTFIGCDDDSRVGDSRKCSRRPSADIPEERSYCFVQ